MLFWRTRMGTSFVWFLRGIERLFGLDSQCGYRLVGGCIREGCDVVGDGFHSSVVQYDEGSGRYGE